MGHGGISRECDWCYLLVEVLPVMVVVAAVVVAVAVVVVEAVVVVDAIAVVVGVGVVVEGGCVEAVVVIGAVVVAEKSKREQKNSQHMAIATCVLIVRILGVKITMTYSMMWNENYCGCCTVHGSTKAAKRDIIITN